MRVVVDRERCMGHGQCNMACPEVYVLDGRGYNDAAHGTEVPAEFEERARRGAEACPEEAITIVGDDHSRRP
jgi:ferredoxin